MMSARTGPMAAVLGLAVSLPAVPAASIVAAGDPATCAGQVVTIDLNQPGAPDPNRDAADVVLGTPDDDIIPTGDGDDWICAGAGDDSVDSDAGDDHVLAGPGDDFVAGWSGADTLNGGRGNDELQGQDGADILRGQAGHDALHVDGGPYPDNAWESAYGGPGNDSIATTKGHEKVIGGPGRDTANYRLTCRDCGEGGGTAGVRVDLTISGPQDTKAGNVDELAGIENIVGGGYDDILLGSGRGNRLIGLFGDDTLIGRAGDDYLRGGRDIDLCRGGPGRDQVTRCE